MTPASYHRSGERLNEAISRSWTALQSAWAHFEGGRKALPAENLGTTLTRERWLLPLFRELDFGRLRSAERFEIEGKSYPISHSWGPAVPIHLVSWRVDLDKTMRGVAGAAAASPHSLLQVFLNRSDERLWGFVSNGYKLRVLRDNWSLTRQAYVEFDLAAMMNADAYSDFRVLWLLCHQSRVEAERPADCWLERWMKEAEQRGARALEQLRGGVEAAIEALGEGFLAHPQNVSLREKLRDGRLNNQNYYRQLLRIVYRLALLVRGRRPRPAARPGRERERPRDLPTVLLDAATARAGGELQRHAPQRSLRGPAPGDAPAGGRSHRGRRGAGCRWQRTGHRAAGLLPLQRPGSRVTSSTAESAIGRCCGRCARCPRLTTARRAPGAMSITKTSDPKS